MGDRTDEGRARIARVAARLRRGVGELCESEALADEATIASMKWCVGLVTFVFLGCARPTDDLNPYCGNGILDISEDCDPPNVGGCSSNWVARLDAAPGTRPVLRHRRGALHGRGLRADDRRRGSAPAGRAAQPTEDVHFILLLDGHYLSAAKGAGHLTSCRASTNLQPTGHHARGHVSRVPRPVPRNMNLGRAVRRGRAARTDG